jgi:Arc/MetJ-type ribon-helix-helix transcriptional regulator
MPKSITVKPKKRGRPATGRDPFVGIRLPSKLINEINHWAAKSEASSRSDAIRRLVEKALAAEQPTSPRPTKGAPKAAELASREIDQLGDPFVSGDERATRKRRLIAGPKEFRDMRDNQPKKKG